MIFKHGQRVRLINTRMIFKVWRGFMDDVLYMTQETDSHGKALAMDEHTTFPIDGYVNSDLYTEV